MKVTPNLADLSPELLCQILENLCLREVLSVGMLCRKLSIAVDMHLRLCKIIDFCEDNVCGYMPSSITDDQLLSLLRRCPLLEIVYGLKPVRIERRTLRKRSALTITGSIEALSLCSNLKAVETSDLKLLEAIMQHLPQIEIIGHFENSDGTFPPLSPQRLKLQSYPRISSLHLIDVEVPELTAMPYLQHLHVQRVRFTKLQPFRAFIALNLKSFIMKNCIGPSAPQRYLSLIIALSSSPNLCRLELVRVPLLSGLFQRAVEDSHKQGGFVNLRALVIADCKGMLETDLGYLMIVASKNLETFHVQPSLTKDSLFVSLSYAHCSFPKLKNLHLGYIDNLNSSGEWTNDALLSLGLAERPDTPSSITDSGMRVISQLFPNIKTLIVSNCPHLILMNEWLSAEDCEAWSNLTDLTLKKCHCLQLSSFVSFLSNLRRIQVVLLNDMFREPPKGCSHVGLSAGTGLGMSSAVVSNQDEHIAVQGHQQDFEQQGDDENEENEREFIDIENDDNPEPQFMVLQQDFFDGENDDGVGRNTMEEGRDLEQELDELQGAVEILHDPLNSSNLKPIYRKSSKSVSVQNLSSNLDKKKKTLDGEKLSIDDKAFVEPDVTDSNYVQEYDPHKPSTSKAGRHLDYCVTYDTKPRNISDSESDSDYEYSSNSNKLKKSSSKQHFSKKAKKQKIANLTENNLLETNSSLKNESSKIQTKTENEIYANSETCAADSPSHSKNINYLSDKKYPYVRICKVILTRCEEEKLFSGFSNNHANKFNSKSDFKMNSYVNNEPLMKYECYVSLLKLDVKNYPTLINNSSEKKQLSENKFLKDNDKNSSKVISSGGEFDKQHLKNVIIDSIIKTGDNVIQNDVSELNMEEIIESGVLVGDLGKTNKQNANKILKTVHANNYTAPKNRNCIEHPNLRQCHVLLIKINKTEYENQHFCNNPIDMTSENKTHINKAIVDKNFNSLGSTEETIINEIHINGNANQNGSAQNNSFIKCNKMPIESVHILSDMKPCYVLLKKVKETTLCMSINYDDIGTETSGNKTDTKVGIPHNTNFASRNENSENLKIHNSQLSSSNFENNINKPSKKSPRNKRKSQSLKCGTSDVGTNNKHKNFLHSKNDIGNQICSTIKSTIKNDSKNDCCEINFSVPCIPSLKKKKLKKSLKDHNNECNYYAVVPKTSNRSLEIVNSSTSESYKIPSISISVSPNNIENSNELHSTSKVKTKCKCDIFKKLNDKQFELSSVYNPHLPSTSKDEINMDCELKMPNFHKICNICVNTVCHKYPFSDRQRNKRLKKSFNIEGKKESDNAKCKNEKIKISQTCKYYHNSSSVSTILSDLKIEKLKITDSDAALLMKRCHVKENNRFNSYTESSLYNNNVNNIEDILIGSHSDEKLKKNPCAEISNTFENSSEYEKDNDIVSKNNGSSENKLKSATYPDKRTTNKKIGKCKIYRKNSLALKRMVTVISQGVQATSADIRRSVRRAKYITAGTYKAASSSHVSKRSSHPNKISAKMVHKKPVSASSRSELHNKTTSTSDPLLEDDAVQTLQLTSNTLLSFTMVSCGISHLVIDNCPRLFHVEAQACRIFKKIELNICPSLKKLNISQCPKLNISAIVDPVLSLTLNSYILVCFEPCMQGYHPGEGEKAIFSKAALYQSVLICHDFSEVSHDGMPTKFKDKLINWLRYLSTLHLSLKVIPQSTVKSEPFGFPLNIQYPWFHDPQKIYGKYTYPSSDFCVTEGKYQLVSNNPIFRDIFETSRLDAGFPNINDCEAYKDNSLLSSEAMKKYMRMNKKFIGFYIPITESNQISTYKMNSKTCSIEFKNF